MFFPHVLSRPLSFSFMAIASVWHWKTSLNQENEQQQTWEQVEQYINLFILAARTAWLFFHAKYRLDFPPSTQTQSQMLISHTATGQKNIRKTEHMFLQSDPMRSGCKQKARGFRHSLLGPWHTLLRIVR